MEAVIQQITALTQVIQNLQQGYLQLKGCLQHPPESPTSRDPGLRSASSPQAASTVVMTPPEPRVPVPEGFFGDQQKFRSFKNACYLYFALQPQTFSTETVKVDFIISLLSGKPQTWAHGLLELWTSSLNPWLSYTMAPYGWLLPKLLAYSTAESAPCGRLYSGVPYMVHRHRLERGSLKISVSDGVV